MASILLTTFGLMGPALLMVRRWQLPFGALTALFGTVAVLCSAIEGFELGLTALAGLVAGVAADLLGTSMVSHVSPATAAARAVSRASGGGSRRLPGTAPIVGPGGRRRHPS